MTTEEQQHVRDVLVFFYPDSPPQGITDELGELAAKMLYEALKASKALDFIPQPPGFKPGLFWLISSAVRIAWKQVGKQKIYEMARVTVARNFKSAYEIAKAGV